MFIRCCVWSEGDINMAIELPLETMTTDEKLQIMESVWQNLCESSEPIQSPEWHAEVVKEREEQLNSGKAIVSEWSVAKQRLREIDS